MIRIDGVSRVFTGRRGHADVPALDRVSLEIGAGEIVAVVGPSGCGKTTLLELICGCSCRTWAWLSRRRRR